MKYLFRRSMSRADVLIATALSSLYTSGQLNGAQTALAAIGCVVLSAIGEVLAARID